MALDNEGVLHKTDKIKADLVDYQLDYLIVVPVSFEGVAHEGTKTDTQHEIEEVLTKVLAVPIIRDVVNKDSKHGKAYLANF